MKTPDKETPTNCIDDVVKKYRLQQLQSYITGGMYETWCRDDMLFAITSPLVKNGRAIDGYRIYPLTNDFSKIGHIDFTSLKFETFEEAARTMCLHLDTEPTH